MASAPDGATALDLSPRRCPLLDRWICPRSNRCYHRHRDPYHPRPVWENFRGLFRAVDQGSASLNIPRYNGGLFAPDPVLDGALAVSDTVCERVAALGRYDYRVPGTVPPDAAGAVPPLVDVEILGHIFEQSISDLEALRASLAAPVPAVLNEGDTPAGAAPATGRESGGGIAGAAASRRRREGAFYTQRFVTRYLVQQALSPVLDRRFEALRTRQAAAASGTAVGALADPKAYVVGDLNRPQRAALVGFWEAWLAELQTVRVLDPACGSGAFLIEAFDQLHTQYAQATDTLEELRPQGLGLFDPDRTILQENLFGVDLNAEAVDIARLSVWVKTAQRGKVLTDLDHNVRVGNSVVADPALDPRAFNWTAAFGGLAGAALGAGNTDRGGVPAGGLFDVVVGNPPYVRAELLRFFKKHWAERFSTYHGDADLYVYFCELGVRLLRPGGRMAYVVPNKWAKTAYGAALRRYLTHDAWLERYVDLGHARDVFPDADIFPALIVVERLGVEPTSGATAVSVVPRESVNLSQLAQQVAAVAHAVPRGALGSAPWQVDAPELASIFGKLRSRGAPLREYAGDEPRYGIKTGYNDAYVLTTPQRDALVAAEPEATALIRPYVRGRDVTRWQAEWADLWMIVMKSSVNHPWPWRSAGERAEAVFAACYPVLHQHFKAHEARLRARSDQGAHWWELRSCDYYDLFDRPKLIWKDLSFYPEFALDDQRRFTNDLCFFVPVRDRWLCAVLNSPLIWSYLWRTTVHGKDEVLRLKTLYMANVPIPTPDPAARAEVEEHVDALVDGTAAQRVGRGAFLDWLRVEFGVERPGEQLAAFDALTGDAFAAQVRKRMGGRGALTPAALRRLLDAHREAAPPLRARAAEAERRERAVSDAVFAAFGLTPDEVDLVWRTAPPRTPLALASETL